LPEKRTLQRARADKKAGKSASTQAGEFIREQIHHIRQGRHGARSTKQAIAQSGGSTLAAAAFRCRAKSCADQGPGRSLA
jgi:hypothetical protein